MEVLPDELLFKVFQDVYGSTESIVDCAKGARADVRIAGIQAKARKFAQLTRVCRRFYNVATSQLYKNIAITNSDWGEAFRWNDILSRSILLHRTLKENPVLRSYCRKLHLWDSRDSPQTETGTDYEIFSKEASGTRSLIALNATGAESEGQQGEALCIRGTLDSIVDDAIPWLKITRELFLIVNPPSTREPTYPFIDLVTQSMPDLRKLEISGFDHHLSKSLTDPHRPYLLKVMRSLIVAKAHPKYLEIYDDRTLDVDYRRKSNDGKCRKIMNMIQEVSLRELHLRYSIIDRPPFELMFSEWPASLQKLTFSCLGHNWGMIFVIDGCAFEQSSASANLYIQREHNGKRGAYGLRFLYSFIYTNLHTLTITDGNIASAKREAPDFPEWSTSFQISKLLITADLSEATWSVEGGDSSFLPEWLRDLSSATLTNGVLSTLKRIHVANVGMCGIMEEAKQKFAQNLGIELTWAGLKEDDH